MMIKLLFIKYIKLKYKLFGNLNYYFLFLKNSIYEMKYIYIYRTKNNNCFTSFS